MIAFLFAAIQNVPSSPVIVKIIEPKKENLYDVLFGALGLTGIMVVGAVVAAVVLGGLLFWLRSRSA